MGICPPVADINENFRYDEGRLFSCLIAVVDRLRGPNGCPWDRKQTEKDVKSMLLEEVYELLSAVDVDDEQEIVEELGDVLLLCVFLAKIYEEKGDFSIADSLDEVISKLIRRHPHVFGNERLETADEVIKNWTRIKNSEKRIKNKPDGIWASVPVAAPSLFQYYEYLKEHKKHGVSLEVDLDREWRDLVETVESANKDNSEREILLKLLIFTVRFAYRYGINPELTFVEEINRIRDNS